MNVFLDPYVGLERSRKSRQPFRDNIQLIKTRINSFFSSVFHHGSGSGSADCYEYIQSGSGSATLTYDSGSGCPPLLSASTLFPSCFTLSNDSFRPLSSYIGSSGV
jgi:hypothetical protein